MRVKIGKVSVPDGCQVLINGRPAQEGDEIKPDDAIAVAGPPKPDGDVVELAID